MQRLAIGLVLVAGLADAAGGHPLAFYLLVLAVPAIAAAALSALASAFEEDSRAVARAWIQAAALLLVLVSAAARAPARGDGVPRVAVTALVVCVLLYASQGARLAWPYLRRRLVSRPLARELTRY
jgi:hypothetical protein